MHASPSSPPIPFQTVAIVGVGLLGGSIAAAVKEIAPATRVIGVGRSAAKLQPAVARGWLNAVTEDVTIAAQEADLVIFCTPVDQIVAGARRAAGACRAGTLLTDVGSVKQTLCAELATGLPSGVEFLGGHPLAGSEKGGFEFARADLFRGRLCVLTPRPENSPALRTRLSQFWGALGAKVQELSPPAHDRALAETSHLPHLVAAALAGVLSAENQPFAATGFRDTTRIASGDPDLWTAILLQNADEVRERLEEFAQGIDLFRQALANRDAAAVRLLLARGKQNRDALSSTGEPTAK